MFPPHAGSRTQVVSLFESEIQPRLKRYLLLTHAPHGLPQQLRVESTPSTLGHLPLRGNPSRQFSTVELKTLTECLDAKQYVYRESEATITINNQSMRLRLGLLPNEHKNSTDLKQYSWWQWVRAERLWSGDVVEAWRIGGHLVPYTIDAPGKWTRPDLTDLGDMLQADCGDILQGDVYLIAWKTGLLQLTVHYKSAYFHTWPKPVPAFPVVYLDRTPDLSPCDLMFKDAPPRVEKIADATILQPWTDLRFLASKSRHEEMIYLAPAKPDVLPAGVIRTFWFNINLNESHATAGGFANKVARYTVPSSWYQHCKVIETDKPGPAAEMARRNVDLITECTQKGGIDTGRVWRYLRRDIRLKKPQEDGAEWEGNLAQAMFNLAYQRGDDPNGPTSPWELYLHHAYHAADVSIYHGAWMGRLECTAAFTAPLPKFRFGGFLYGYLETGDPYLLELSRSVAGVYMAMEWALEPRSCIGRDAYPISNLMSLYDYDPQPLYKDFAKQMIERLLVTSQQPDGGFSSQSGAGVLTGVSCKPGVRDIHFGSGILSPVAITEWATRDNRWPDDLLPRLKKWADLMLALQKEDGHWYVEGRSDEPYTLTGSATVLTLTRAAQLLNDPRYLAAVKKYLDNMNENHLPVLGTHSFLSAQYAHVADAALARME